MSGYVDPHRAAELCTRAELDVVRLRNDGKSWRAIAMTLVIARSTVKDRWASANRKVNGPTPERITTGRGGRENFIGDEELMRGIPVSGFGGAVRGTRPGDPAWRAVADQHLPRPKRKAS